jgi:hypothetical protein
VASFLSYKCHYFHSSLRPLSLQDASGENTNAVLERGALDGRDVGEFVPIDYNHVKYVGQTPSSFFVMNILCSRSLRACVHPPEQ